MRNRVSAIEERRSFPGCYDLPAVRAGRFYVVDSPAYFSRPGPRIVHAPEILAEILPPTLFGAAALRLRCR